MVCITINLYHFILCILNNLKKNNYTEIYRRNNFVGIGQWVPQSSTNIQTDKFGRYSIHSPTELPTNLIRRYLTLAAKCTNEFTDGYIWSVSQTHTDQVTDGYYPSVITISPTEYFPSVYLKREFFFCAHFPSVKPSVSVFFPPTNIATECGIINKR